MLEKILEKHIEMIGKLKLPKTAKRILLIKSAVMAGLFSGDKLTKVVRQIAEKLNISETTVWNVIKFDKVYKQIESDYMEVFEYLKAEKIKELLGGKEGERGGDNNSNSQSG